MRLEFNTIDLNRDYERCVQARRDAYFCSFHTNEGFTDFIDGYRERISERLGQALTIPSYERGVARLLRYDRHP
ncbi:hypothetical protein [Aeromonas sp. TW 6]|uniref:hypothetical protein n=1 Tax=Aeromonas TaxID=642 RepID=UPI0039063285